MARGLTPITPHIKYWPVQKAEVEETHLIPAATTQYKEAWKTFHYFIYGTIKWKLLINFSNILTTVDI